MRIACFTCFACIGCFAPDTSETPKQAKQMNHSETVTLYNKNQDYTNKVMTYTFNLEYSALQCQWYSRIHLHYATLDSSQRQPAPLHPSLRNTFEHFQSPPTWLA